MAHAEDITGKKYGNLKAISYVGNLNKGIKLKWSDFQSFFKDMGPTYQHGLTIERIDPAGDYEKTNCKWASWTEQFANRGGRFAKV